MAKPVSPKPAARAPVTLAPVKAFAVPDKVVEAAPKAPAAAAVVAGSGPEKKADARKIAGGKPTAGKVTAGKPASGKSKAAAGPSLSTKPAVAEAAERPSTASTVVEAAVRASDQTLAATATPEVKQIAKPAAEAGAAVARTVAATVDKAVSETTKITEETGKAAARNVETLVSAGAQAVETARKTVLAKAATPLPKPPEAAALAGSALLEQTLVFARLMGNLQAQMLDHACAELKATLTAAETLARADSASEAIKVQAAAVRRGYEAGAAHLTELARTAQSALKR